MVGVVAVMTDWMERTLNQVVSGHVYGRGRFLGWVAYHYQRLKRLPTLISRKSSYKPVII